MARLNKFLHTCNNFRAAWFHMYIAVERLKHARRLRMHCVTTTVWVALWLSPNTSSHFGVAQVSFFRCTIEHRAWSRHKILCVHECILELHPSLQAILSELWSTVSAGCHQHVCVFSLHVKLEVDCTIH